MIPSTTTFRKHWKGVVPPAKFVTTDVRGRNVPGQTIVDQFNVFRIWEDHNCISEDGRRRRIKSDAR